jgi:hypothetical protein
MPWMMAALFPIVLMGWAALRFLVARSRLSATMS